MSACRVWSSRVRALLKTSVQCASFANVSRTIGEFFLAQLRGVVLPVVRDPAFLTAFGVGVDPAPLEWMGLGGHALHVGR